jgi:hypothetical protein
VEEAMLDMVLKPDLVKAAVARFAEACLYQMKQYKDLNLLALNNVNCRIGSGGLGFTAELPQPDFNPDRVRTIDQWGCSNAQIFSDVSPEMHEEFSLQFERKWLAQFGLTYYGCCEPLHNKLEILKTIPNLRKISMSPWAKVGKMLEGTAGRYVLSFKPNPAILAGDDWRPGQARKELAAVLDQCRDVCLEVIMKDISTVRHEPRRLWEWCDIAMETAAKYE